MSPKINSVMMNITNISKQFTSNEWALIGIATAFFFGLIFTLMQIYGPVFIAWRANQYMKRQNKLQNEFFSLEDLKRNAQTYVEPRISFDVDPSNFDETSQHQEVGLKAFSVIESFLSEKSTQKFVYLLA